MRFAPSTISLALAGVLAASAALAQQPAPPPGPPDQLAAQPAPPPPGGPRPDRPPPPPPGAHVMIDREANGVVRVDVHCAQQDSTKDCAAIATRLLADTNSTQPAK